MRCLLFVLGCLAAAGQGLEIRGLVQEWGSEAPVPGAEVTIKEFILVDNVVTPKVVATILTNPRGEYSFHPEHIANFYILARKDGYEDATSRGQEDRPPAAEQPASVTREQPVATVSPLRLIRPGEISGKVVDGDGNPRAGLPLRISVTPSPIPIDVKTDQAGEFRFTGLAPGKYLIRIAPTNQLMPEFMPYSEAEADKVDEGVEYSYWPGGTNDPSRALPVQVEPGSRISVGTLAVRTLKYPRVHVSVEGDCIAKTWGYVFRVTGSANRNPGFTVSPCERDFLLKFVPPEGGAIYMADLKSKRWASAEVIVNERQPTAVLRIHEPVDIPVRITGPEGVPLASFGKIQVAISGADRSLPFGNSITIDPGAAGAMLPQVPWSAFRIGITPQQPGTYVKAIRYYGTALRDPVFEAVAGAALEIELDDNAPALQGTVLGRDEPDILVVRWPTSDDMYAGSVPPFRYMRPAGPDGKFSMRIAPGEYRVIAVSSLTLPAIGADELRQLFSTGERVVVGRGEEKTLDLKVTAR
jgi:hypothetical protein